MGSGATHCLERIYLNFKKMDAVKHKELTMDEANIYKQKINTQKVKRFEKKFKGVCGG